MPSRKNRPYPSGYYGQAHKAMRRRLDPAVQTGTVPCVRCGELIEPNTPWDLDHRDDGRGYLGPSHARCNRATNRGREPEPWPATSRIW